MIKKIRKNVLYSVIVAAFSFTLLSFTSIEVSAQQGLSKIAENVYSYVDVKGASPKNSFGANAGIIIGRDGILVVDTLISAKEARRFIRDIRAITDKPVKYVVNTHSHLDHTFGNSEFAKIGATIISQTNCRKNLQINGEATMKRAKAYGLTDADLEGTTITLPAITFTGRMELDLGGQMVELIDYSPSHTNDSILVYLPDRKILFAGDVLFTGYHPNLTDGDLAGWIKTLDFMLTLDAAAIVPGHGPVSGSKDVTDMKDYINTFDRKAKELAASSKDIGYITSELKKSLQQRPELEFLIGANVQARYLKKDN